MIAVLAALTLAAGCAATPVHGNVVRAGPFAGHVDPHYDVVAGRFRLHVGGFRDRRVGLSQKIGWTFPSRLYRRVGESLVVEGRRVGSPGRRFRQGFALAYASSGPFFATNISPPSAGCWRLAFSSGTVAGALTVLVR